MNTESKIAVMSAYVDGDMIEYRNKTVGGDWSPYTKTVPLWDWPDYDYRINPEEKKPKTLTIEIWADGMGRICECIAGTRASKFYRGLGWELILTRDPYV